MADGVGAWLGALISDQRRDTLGSYRAVFDWRATLAIVGLNSWRLPALIAR